MACIFVDQPKECETCLDSRKLQCLINKRHLKVHPEAEAELVKLLMANINNPNRYKIAAGEEGREH